jgi:hypothetical protein
MNAEQSKNLKAGDHVYFGGDRTDLGTVIGTETRYVTIKWNDGHKSLSGHKNMERVDLVSLRVTRGETKPDDLQGH